MTSGSSFPHSSGTHKKKVVRLQLLSYIVIIIIFFQPSPFSSSPLPLLPPALETRILEHKTACNRQPLLRQKHDHETLEQACTPLASTSFACFLPSKQDAIHSTHTQKETAHRNQHSITSRACESPTPKAYISPSPHHQSVRQYIIVQERETRPSHHCVVRG